MADATKMAEMKITHVGYLTLREIANSLDRGGVAAASLWATEAVKAAEAVVAIRHPKDGVMDQMVDQVAIGQYIRQMRESAPVSIDECRELLNLVAAVKVADRDSDDGGWSGMPVHDVLESCDDIDEAPRVLAAGILRQAAERISDIDMD